MIFIFGLAMALEGRIQAALFSWVPDWLIVVGGPDGMAMSSRNGALAVWVLSGLVGAGIGGWTQELYHRGFLLPRASHLGWRAVFLNASAFAVMHTVAPWGWPFFFLGSLTWAAAVYRWRSIQLGLAGHVGMLAIGWLLMTAVTFGWLEMPATP